MVDNMVCYNKQDNPEESLHHLNFCTTANGMITLWKYLYEIVSVVSVRLSHLDSINLPFSGASSSRASR